MAKYIYCETLGQSASYFLSRSTLDCWSRNLDYTEESVPVACRGAVHLWVCSSTYGRADRTHRKWPGARCSVRKTLSDITISSKRSSAPQEAHKRGQLENNYLFKGEFCFCWCLKLCFSARYEGRLSGEARSNPEGKSWGCFYQWSQPLCSVKSLSYF